MNLNKFKRLNSVPALSPSCQYHLLTRYGVLSLDCYCRSLQCTSVVVTTLQYRPQTLFMITVYLKFQKCPIVWRHIRNCHKQLLLLDATCFSLLCPCSTSYDWLCACVRTREWYLLSACLDVIKQVTFPSSKMCLTMGKDLFFYMALQP